MSKKSILIQAIIYLAFFLFGLIVITFINSCVQDRTDINPKRVNVEDTKQWKMNCAQIIDSKLISDSIDKWIKDKLPEPDTTTHLIISIKEYSQLKDSLEILKDQIKMKDLMLDYQKDAMIDLKDEIKRLTHDLSD